MAEAQRIEARPHEFGVKWYLNGFPKSGLHLAALMMLPMAKPQMEEVIWTKPWAGLYINNSWSTDRIELEKFLYKVGRVTDGHYLKGHSGYAPEVERFLYYLGAAHVFIYRDLRDVAVSQSYHVVADDDTRFAHPQKDRYRALGSHEEVLKAVIAGIDGFPGVLARWEEYAPWLEVDWVHHVTFERLRQSPHEASRDILLYGLGRVAPIFGATLNVIPEMFDVVVDAMVEAAGHTEFSVTYRKGTVGQWQDEFTPEVADLFKETDTNHWLERLGYADNDNW